MRSAVLRACALISGGLTVSLCLYSQSTSNPAARANEPGALPPRAAPSDYPSQAKAGSATIAAEFKGHFVPTLEGTLTSEDYIVVEAALFGQPGARANLSVDDFSLRVNGKKTSLPAQSYALLSASIKDPDWAPPEPPPSKNKTSLTGGGGGNQNDSGPPPPVHVPVEVRRSWVARMEKASMAEGDRPLPQAGLLFFSYRGQSKGINSLELIYKGSGGQTTLTLQP